MKVGEPVDYATKGKMKGKGTQKAIGDYFSEEEKEQAPRGKKRTREEAGLPITSEQPAKMKHEDADNPALREEIELQLAMIESLQLYEKQKE